MDRAKRRLVIGAGIATCAASGGAGLALFLRSSSGEAKALREARFHDLSGKPRTLAEWPERRLMVNFWATWCAPCLEEIPMLGDLRQAYGTKGIEVVGIAIDQATKVQEMVNKLSVQYPILIADSEGLQLLRKIGNSSGGLPYTLMLDRKLEPSARKLGALKRPEAEAMVRQALAG